MALSPELIERASALRSDAVAELFSHEFVRVYRIAYGLAGRADLGKRIARFVFSRAVRVLPSWDPHSEPEHWFRRYTVITARQVMSRESVEARRDLLVSNDPQPDAEYVAFVAALRGLPRQQQEAFLLQYGVRFNLRDAARAMECSTEAAANHLAGAVEGMKLVAAEGFERLSARVGAAYARLTPGEELVIPNVAGMVRRYVWPRRVWRILVRVLTLVVLVAMIWGAWKLYQVVRI
jgi:DNA-directed RNA polymerase specialized sigma24 family protein